MCPEAGVGTVHSHDSIGQLCFEQTGQMRLAAKFEWKGEINGVMGIHVIGGGGGAGATRRQGGIVQPTHVAFILYFIGGPATAFLITHTNTTLIAATTTMPTQTFVTGEGMKGGGIVFDPQAINVIFGYATGIGGTATTGKGRDATAGIDNDGLALRGCATPQVGVVCAKALEQGGDEDIVVIVGCCCSGGGGGGGCRTIVVTQPTQVMLLLLLLLLLCGLTTRIVTTIDFGGFLPPSHGFRIDGLEQGALTMTVASLLHVMRYQWQRYHRRGMLLLLLLLLVVVLVVVVLLLLDLSFLL